MCMMAALPILSLAVGAGQAIMGFQAQSQAASRQNAFYYQNAEAANKAVSDQYAFTQLQRQDQRASADQDKMQTDIAGMKARGTAVTAAGESGVSGLSVDALIGDYWGQQGRRDQSIDSNYAMQSDYLTGQMSTQYAGATSRINSVQRAAPPSFADALLRIGGAGVNAMTLATRQSYYGGMGGGYGGGFASGYDGTNAMDFS